MASENLALRRKSGYGLAVAAFCCAIIVVALGAFTRLVDAGLGCPDWPGCYGHLLWPIQDHNVARANEAWPHMPVDHDKTWPEMVHRYFAGFLGVLIVTIAVRAWRRREERDSPFRLPVLLLFVVVWQALFGMWTVTLKLWPQVVTLHLIGGMTVLSLLWLLVNRLGNVRWHFDAEVLARLARFKPWIIGAIVIVAIQILLGGWTTSNYAAYACPDFPMCHREWVPPMDLAKGFDIFQTIGPNYLGGQLENEARVAIHYMHRVGALVVMLYLLMLAANLMVVGDRRLTNMAWLVLGALALQISLGIGNVLMHIPLAVAVAHNAGAGLLLITLISLASRVWMAESRETAQS